MKLTLRGMILFVLILSCVVGLGSCCAKFAAITRPEPIRAGAIDGPFYVVGFDRQHRPVLLEDERSFTIRWGRARHHGPEKAFRESFEDFDPPVLWADDCGPGGRFTFYISPRNVKAIEQSLSDPNPSSLRRVAIKVLSDDPTAREQRVSVTVDRDDYTYFSIYRADGSGIEPLEYGDCVKRDGVVALAWGMRNALIVLAIGCLLAVAVQALRRRAPGR